MAMMMDAIVKQAPKPGLTLCQQPIPAVGADDVLIKVKCTGICGTDVQIYQWNEWASATIPTPMIVGHEFVGEIVELGSHVRDLKIGDCVSAEGHVVCGHCRNCRAGRFHLCKSDSGIGVNRPGAFANYVLVPKTNVWVHSEGIDTDLMSIFDPFGNATHTALSFSVLGEDVLITGAGPIGLMAAAIVCHAGARHVVITDVNDYRLSIAAKLNPKIHAINVASTSIREVMTSLKMTEGFDVGLEMSGIPHAFNDMVAAMANGGRIALLGIPKQGTVIDWSRVVFKGLSIKGVYGRKMWETWYMMTSMLQSGLNILPVITHRFHYTEFEKGFETIFSGQSGKVLLDWS